MAEAHFLDRFDPSTPLPPGRHGAATPVPGVTLRRLEGLAVASIVAARGAAPAVVAAIAAAHDVTIADAPEVRAGAALCCVGTGPGKWLAVAPVADGEAFAAGLQATLAETAAVCDQSDGTVILELRGPGLREALSRVLTIDLDPAVFGDGAAATTLLAHVGVTLWLIDPAPVIHLAVGRSLAEAATRALAAAAAGHGFELIG